MAKSITAEEIIDFYKSNKIVPIRKEDLLRPSKDFVLDLYIRILDKMDIFNVNQPDILACINGFNERMEKNFIVMNVYAIINRFVSNVGLNDFRIIDILNPKRNKTIRILHALANYYVRHNTLKAESLEYANKFSALHHERKKLKKRLVTLKNSIEDVSVTLSTVKNKYMGIEKEIKSSEEVFSTRKIEAEKKEKVFAEIKAENLELNEQSYNIQLELGQFNETNKKLSDKIIKSPNKIISAKNNLENKLKTLKDENQMLKCQYNELQNKSSYLISKTLFDAIKENKEFLELQISNDEQCKELDEKIKNTLNFNEEMIEIEVKNKKIEECIQSVQTDINKYNIEIDRKKLVHIKLLNGLKEKYEQNEKNIEKFKEIEIQKTEQFKKIQNENDELCRCEQQLNQRCLNIHRNNVEKYFRTKEYFQKLVMMKNNKF